MKIKVTAKDIRNASPGDPRHCAVARALRRAGFKNVFVAANYFYEESFGLPFGSPKRRYFPPRVQENIERLDSGGELVEPFSFETIE